MQDTLGPDEWFEVETQCSYTDKNGTMYDIFDAGECAVHCVCVCVCVCPHGIDTCCLPGLHGRFMHGAYSQAIATHSCPLATGGHSCALNSHTYSAVQLHDMQHLQALFP